jgi:hypothetical protein
MSAEEPETPPGAVSDQNTEEAPAHLGDGLHRRKPDSDERAAERDDDGGAAGEGSQSTGHSESAG